MKKPVAMTLALLICSFIFVFSAGAVDAPHYDPSVGNVCGTCHTAQQTLGSTGYNNICQNCHRPGSPSAGSKPITPADAANPFGIHSTTGITKMYQTSHRWDGSDTNPSAGAQPPVQGQMTTNGLRSRTGGQLACVRCHNQHSNANGNFLRIANDKDQLCLDCHRSRDVQSHTQGSHPVGINYAAKVAANPTLFKAKTVNANAANPTSNLFTRMSSAGGTLLCSTCHSVHFADSRSSTPDGNTNFANLSSGDGYLLRTERRGVDAGAGFDSSTNICTNCHAGKTSHNLKGQNIQCNDCHGAHVEYDPNDPSGSKGKNIYLIRRAVDKGNTGSGSIFFRYTGSRTEYRNAQNTGVCQGCHSVPEGSNYPAEHSATGSTAKDCNTCHFHGSTNGSFSGACTACHGYPPLTATLGGPSGLAIPATAATATSPGAHFTHAKKRWMACNTCHTGYAGKAMPSNTIDIGFSINSSNFKGFTGNVNGGVFNGTALNAAYSWSTSNGTTLTTGNANISCSVYCHGATLASGTGNKPVWTGSNQAACGSCHKVANNDSGSHAKHLSANSDCGTCHTGASLTLYTAQTHVNGQIDVANGYTAASKSCSSASCHADPYSSGSATTPQWGTSAAACAACHNGAGAFSSSNGPATGSHSIHLAVLITCGDCHTGATAGVTGGTGHANGYIDVANGYPSSVTKHAAGSGYSDCSAASCHSNPYGTGNVTTPVWGANTPGRCTACHNGTGAFDATSGAPATGSHTSHMALSGALCSQCHTNATVASYVDGKHKNGNIDVSNGYPATVAKHPAGSGYATCSAASCHADPYGPASAVSPVWGTAAGCTACHSAYPMTASGPSADSGTTATGSHKQHMAVTGIACTDCHAAGTSATVTPSANHANGTIDANGAKNTGVAAITKHAAGTYTTTCSAATCHADPYGPTAAVSPVWGASAGCSACHGAYPVTASGPSSDGGTTATGAHKKHMAVSGTACTDCHATGTSSTVVPSTNHANGTIDANGTKNSGVAAITKHSTASTLSCSAATCHADPYGTGSVATPTWSTSGSGCAACHTGVNVITANGPATGAHHKHMTSTITASVCTDCHASGTTATVSPSVANGHTTGTIDANGTKNSGVAAITKHSAASTLSCSAATCHADPYSAGMVPTPTWSTSGSGCAACHTGVNVITANGPATGAHNKHMTSTGIACADCHATGTTATTAPSVANGHTTGAIDANGTKNSGIAAITKHSTASTLSCSAATCHADPYSAGMVPTPTWSTSGSGCAACHTGVNVITANGPATGAHNKHMTSTGIACADCHAAGTTATTSPSVANGHTAGTIDANGTKNSGVAAITKHSTASTLSCSAATCHADPYSVGMVPTPTWSTSGSGCTACHTGVNAITATGPATGAHNRHMTLSGAACTDCHATGTTATTAPTLANGHTDGNIDVIGTKNTGGTTNMVKHTTASTLTCSTATCHGSVNAASPAWGSAASGNNSCTICHGTATATVTASNYNVVAPSATDASATDAGKVSPSNAKTGAHQTHLTYLNGLSSQGTDPQARCLYCHTANATSNHANGNSTPVFSGLALGNGGLYATSYNAGTCSVYCHNPAGTNGTLAATNAPAVTTVSWTDASYLTYDGTVPTFKTDANCNKCHLSPNGSRTISTGQNHSAYTINTDCSGCHKHNGDAGSTDGIHFHMDGFKWGTGGAGGCASCHGYGVGTWAAAPVAINTENKGAHEKHIAFLTTKPVSVALNPLTDTYGGATTAWTNVCGVCHGLTPPAANHQNNSVQVSISNTYLFGTSGSPTYNSTGYANGSKTCSNVSCHYFTTPVWSTY